MAKAYECTNTNKLHSPIFISGLTVCIGCKPVAHIPVLQIRGVNRDNLGISLDIFLHLNIFRDPPLDPSRIEPTRNEGSKHIFSLSNKTKLSLNYPQYTLLFVVLMFY